MSDSRSRLARQRKFRSEIAAAVLWLAVIPPITALSPRGDAQGSINTSAVAAQEFVRSDLDRGLAILNDRSAPDPERRAKLRAYLNSFMDVRRMALFSLGLGRRSATPEQIEAFENAFRDYTITRFESLLTRYYAGQTVRVTGVSQDDPNSYRIYLVLDSLASVEKNRSIDLGVKVIKDNGRFVVTDVAAMGVWFSMEQRDAVNDYLLQTHGNFGGLITRYRTFALQRRGGRPGAI